MHPKGASKNKDDHAIFSKAGPYLSKPDETKRPRVIPKIYKLKNNKRRGRPNFKIETPNNEIIDNRAHITEWLYQVGKKQYDAISSKLEEITNNNL